MVSSTQKKAIPQFCCIFYILQVAAFLSKVLKLACQNRISPRRAAVLTYMGNSLINAIRLQNVEERIAAKDPENLNIDWTDVPRPERELQPYHAPPSHPVRHALSATEPVPPASAPA